MHIKSIPETLYKFRDWSNEYNRKLLVENEIYFSNNFSFNDPFDLQLPILISKEIPFDRNSFVENTKNNLGRVLTENEIRKVEELYPQVVKENLDIIESERREFEIEARKIDDRLGVFCISMRNDSSLMWGHYSNSHKGFCVGFDSEMLKTYINKTFPKSGGLLEVNYEKNIPIFNFSLDIDEIKKYSRKRFNTKFYHWSYEDEIRVIVDNMANKAHKIPKEIFKEVIFGYKMCEEQKEEIRNICGSLYPSIKYFKSEPNKDTFEMKISKIE